MVQNPLRKKRAEKELDPFKISGMYLLNADGIVIFHKDITFHKEFDADIFGSMFTAIKMFIEGSLNSNTELRNIDYGQFKILIEQGNDFFLVVVGKGTDIEPVRESMCRVIEEINERYGETIADWSGDVEVFKGIESKFQILTDDFKPDYSLGMDILPDGLKDTKGSVEEIKIPYEYASKIDKIIRSGASGYPSREEFIKGAVEMKLNQLKGFDSGRAEL